MLKEPGARAPIEPGLREPTVPDAGGPDPPGAQGLSILALVVLIGAALVVAGVVTWEGDPAPPLADEPPLAGVGLSSTATERSPEKALDRVEAELEADGRQEVFARVEHPDDPNGGNVRLVSLETLVFGDRAAMAPLIERNQLAALDLPLALAAWDKSETEYTQLVHASPAYLAERHGLRGARELDRIEDTLRGLVEAGGGAGITPSLGVGRAALRDGVVVRRAEGEVGEVVERVKQAARDMQLELVETVDLTQDAGRARLRPTTVVLVSAPRLEAALLRSQSTVAVDLPQRIVVYETPGSRTRLAYSDPAYTARRHGVSGEDGAVRGLSERLKKLARAAAG